MTFESDDAAWGSHESGNEGEIAAAIGNASLPGISARLRDLRKPRFGGYTVERRYVRDGLWEYRVKR